GRLRNETSASIYDFLASRADLETARLTVIASTSATYLELAALRSQLTLSEENIDVLRERAELTEERYRAGLTNSFELYSIRQEYRTAQSELPGLRTQVTDAEGRLALILGRYAGRVDDVLLDEPSPTVDTSPISAGLPVRLLERRPDVLAAFERLEAARLRVGARRAELLPTISLNGSVGFQSSDPDDLFRADQWFLNLVGGIVAPLFQGGRLRANLGVAEAQYDQLIIAYVRTVLQAYHEVRTSLFRLDNERERYARVLDQVAEAQASLDYQLRRYRSGVGDYVSYLDARRNLIGARTTLSAVERGVGEARLAVHRALGGTWVPAEDELEGPRRTEAVVPENR
ncbi:MAG: TolC family protein, partial [Gemmatimonadetes bacterium]|nr:TolC family protein [Gemmatimonadota bacterium]